MSQSIRILRLGQHAAWAAEGNDSGGAGDSLPKIERKDRIQVDPDLLRRLYEECGGWKQRIHERLVEEHQIQISYHQTVLELPHVRNKNLRNLPSTQSAP
jgi:hypothetical protein